MTKCYGHEECEFNGQPECRLPDGVPCPHGVTADKPAAESKTDIEALIERLNQYSQSLIVCQMGGEFSDVCLDAATALSTIQVKKAEMQKQLNEFSEFLCHLVGEMSSEKEKLQAELKSKVDLVFQQAKELDRRNLLLREQEAELDQVKKCIEIVEFQRDAAIDQLHGYCPSCTHYTPNHNEGPCRTCKHEYYHRLNNESLDNWEWRGPHKEED